MASLIWKVTGVQISIWLIYIWNWKDIYVNWNRKYLTSTHKIFSYDLERSKLSSFIWQISPITNEHQCQNSYAYYYLAISKEIFCYTDYNTGRLSELWSCYTKKRRLQWEECLCAFTESILVSVIELFCLLLQDKFHCFLVLIYFHRVHLKCAYISITNAIPHFVIWLQCQTNLFHGTMNRMRHATPNFLR